MAKRKLTRYQRKLIYTECKKMLRKGYQFYICSTLIALSLKLYDVELDHSILSDTFPEFKKYYLTNEDSLKHLDFYHKQYGVVPVLTPWWPKGDISSRLDALDEMLTGL